MTPHIESRLEDISNIVIMPGDPKRCEYIAKNYLTDYKLVNQVRNITAYSGYYKNKFVTIFPSGMGIPSMGIYSHELFTTYNVDYIIRVGSVGSYRHDINIYDLVLVDKSYSISNYGIEYAKYENNFVESNNDLNQIIKNTARNLDYSLKFGNIHTTTAFYNNMNIQDLSDRYNCLGAEMECYALFLNALVNNKKAACILTCSNEILTNKETTSEEREKSFDDMILLALNSILNL